MVAALSAAAELGGDGLCFWMEYAEELWFSAAAAAYVDYGDCVEELLSGYCGHCCWESEEAEEQEWELR